MIPPIQLYAEQNGKITVIQQGDQKIKLTRPQVETLAEALKIKLKPR